MYRMQKRGQLTIFIIIALVIIVGIGVFIFFRSGLGIGEIPAELQPVYGAYLGCVEQEAREAIELAGSQGGRVFVEEYEPGSEYAPFSSQLSFLGLGIPYWYYVSGNGLIKEQMPSKSEMESEIGEYIQRSLNDCELESFYSQGFDIEAGEPEVRVRVENERVGVEVVSDVVVSKDGDSARKTSHEVEVRSKLGKFYDTGKRIYDKQKEEAFLEEYAIDVLRLYAPVDGVEVSCSPQIWETREVVEELYNGLEANVGALKFRGNYYTLDSADNEYFVIEQDVDEAVNLIYSREWPSKIEIFGESVDESLMIAEPIGNQQGLGAMGFCYVPYHFVYDVSFPVLMQVYNSEEVFQFPVVVVIDNNVAREAVFSELGEEEEFDLCEFKTQDIEVNVFDVNLNRVDADIGYECFDQRCRLGETEGGRFIGQAPGCVNGFLTLRTEGFADKKQQFSSNEEFSADVILDREYAVSVELEVGGSDLEGNAIVSFIREDEGRAVTAALPEANNVVLSEGSYDVRVYVYGDSSIVIPESVTTRCQDVPKGGVLGFFGVTREECFEITIPETKIESALIGGGESRTYLLESELEKGRAIVRVQGLQKPETLEQLQYNFEIFDSLPVDVEFNE